MRKKLVKYARVWAWRGLLTASAFAQAPSFDDFAGWLSQWSEKVYTIDGVDPNKSLQDNLINLFYPDVTGNKSILRQYIRIIWVGLFVLFMIFNATSLLLNGSDETKVKSSLQNIGVGFLGAVLYFGAVRIVGIALNLTASGPAQDIITNVQQRVLFQVLLFLKAAAFFAAIIALIAAWLKVMAAMDQEDKIKSARRGFLNIIIALVFIKVIDFLYLIAQKNSFASDATTVLISIAKIVWRIMGAALVIAVIVAGYLFITDTGSGDGAKKGKNIIITVFFVWLTIFLFLLIIYQLLVQFG